MGQMGFINETSYKKSIMTILQKWAIVIKEANIVSFVSQGALVFRRHLQFGLKHFAANQTDLVPYLVYVFSKLNP